MLDFLFQIVQHFLQLRVGNLVRLPAGGEQLAERFGTTVGQQPRNQFGQTDDLWQLSHRRDGRRERLAGSLPANGLDERIGQAPAIEQPGRQHGMVEAQRFRLQHRQAVALSARSFQALDVRLAKLLYQQKDTQVLQQPGDERFVARFVPESLGDAARGHGLGKRVSPIVPQHFGGQPLEESLRQTEPQDQQFQRLDAQQGQGLIQVGDLASQAE